MENRIKRAIDSLPLADQIVGIIEEDMLDHLTEFGSDFIEPNNLDEAVAQIKAEFFEEIDYVYENLESYTENQIAFAFLEVCRQYANAAREDRNALMERYIEKNAIEE